MQDYGRAVIVGSSEQTHGKGTVQAVLPLDNYAGPVGKVYSPLGALKITIQMFFRVTGGSTQFKGVHPDIVLPDRYAYLESGEKSLDFAIPYQSTEPAAHAKWKHKFDVEKLKKSSSKRVSKSEKFKKIQESVKWYNERKEETERSLRLAMSRPIEKRPKRSLKSLSLKKRMRKSL